MKDPEEKKAKRSVWTAYAYDRTMTTTDLHVLTGDAFYRENTRLSRIDENPITPSARHEASQVRRAYARHTSLAPRRTSGRRARLWAEPSPSTQGGARAQGDVLPASSLRAHPRKLDVGMRAYMNKPEPDAPWAGVVAFTAVGCEMRCRYLRRMPFAHNIRLFLRESDR